MERPDIASSAIIRLDRAKTAIGVIKDHPILGGGWGASGLVHSDILQMGADAGVITAELFVIFYLQILNGLRNSISKSQDPEMKEYRIAFLSSLFGFLFSFFIEAYFNLPEIYAPFWFMLGMGWLLAKFEDKKQEHVKEA